MRPRRRRAAPAGRIAPQPAPTGARPRAAGHLAARQPTTHPVTDPRDRTWRAPMTAADPTDKLLVASVLERGKRRDVDDDMVAGKDTEDEEEDAGHRPGRRAGRRCRGRRGRPPALGGATCQARPSRAGGAHPRGARAAPGGHGRHRRPGPHVPQGDRQGPAPQRRGGGRAGQVHRARRADRRGALEGRPLALGVDPERHREEDPHQVPAAPAAVQGGDRPRSSGVPSVRRPATGCSSAPRRPWARSSTRRSEPTRRRRT